MTIKLPEMVLAPEKSRSFAIRVKVKGRKVKSDKRAEKTYQKLGEKERKRNNYNATTNTVLMDSLEYPFKTFLLHSLFAFFSPSLFPVSSSLYQLKICKIDIETAFQNP